MVNQLSCASLRLDLYCHSTFITHATGFLVPSQNDVYLVSNWHVFSGLNANDMSPMDKKNGAIPTRALFHYRMPTDPSTCCQIEIPLQDNDHNPFWKEHPQGRAIDLAAVHIPELDVNHQVFPTQGSSHRPLSKRVTQQCFVVGFPFGIANPSDFPVWKSATIASEFSFGYTSPNNFLVDSTVTPGMSGSPVYLRASGNFEFEDGSATMFAGSVKEVFEFLGVYSGRIQSTKEGGALDIGLVWKRQCIDELLNAQRISEDFLGFYGKGA